VAAHNNDKTTIGTIFTKMNANMTSQIFDLEMALLFLALWLAIYIVWWVLSKQIREENDK
jgi:hypothetical protein